jgi:hypothetical protein
LVKLKSGEDNELLRVPRRPTQDEQLVIANQHVSLTFDKNAGRLVRRQKPNTAHADMI